MTYCERCGYDTVGIPHEESCETALSTELDELDKWMAHFIDQPGASEMERWRAALAAVRRNRLFLAAKLEQQKPVFVGFDPANHVLDDHAVVFVDEEGRIIPRPTGYRWAGNKGGTLADYYRDDDARRFTAR